MLTNWKTISHSIKRLRQVQEILDEGGEGLTKKETLNLTRERDKLERALGGIKDMGGIPDLLFIIDTNKEHLAIKEAQKLNIPVAAVLDSNSDPDGITYPIPGNDDALRAISLYCELVGDAVLDGISAEVQASGGDPGEAAEAGEPIPEEAELAAAGESQESAAGSAESQGAGESQSSGAQSSGEQSSGDQSSSAQGSGEKAEGEQAQGEQAKSA
jgi:small subunit ribosomal protein S2